MLTERAFQDAVEQYLDMVYRIALNWFRGGRFAERHAAALADGHGISGGGSSAPLACSGDAERVQAHLKPSMAKPDGAAGELPGTGVYGPSQGGAVSGSDVPACQVPRAVVPLLL